VFSPDIGYVQGFNFIVGILQKVALDQIYLNEMPGLKALNFMMEVLVQNYIPELDQKFEKDGIQVDFVSSQWFITLFSHDLSLDNFLVILVMMAFFGQKVLLQVGLGLVEEVKEAVLEMPMEEALVFLKDFTQNRQLEVDQVFQKALA